MFLFLSLFLHRKPCEQYLELRVLQESDAMGILLHMLTHYCQKSSHIYSSANVRISLSIPIPVLSPSFVYLYLCSILICIHIYFSSLFNSPPILGFPWQPDLCRALSCLIRRCILTPTRPSVIRVYNSSTTCIMANCICILNRIKPVLGHDDNPTRMTDPTD